MRKHLHERVLTVTLLDIIMIKGWQQDPCYPKRTPVSKSNSEMEKENRM